MKIYYKIVLLYVLLLGTGCKKLIEVAQPSNKLNSETVFQSDATATAAVTGIYAQMGNSWQFFPTAGSPMFLGLYSDELQYTNTGTAIIEFEEGNLSISNGTVYNSFWRPAYDIIFRANSAIEGLQNSPITPSVREQLLGEAYFLRAFCYYNLVVNFGDVPLVLTSTDYKGTAAMQRTASLQINQQILDDVAEAKKYLKPAYPTAGKVRPNYYTACALAARVYLYLGNWNEVLQNSNEIISQATYAIENDLSKIFLIGSTEAIWQLANDGSTTNSVDATQFIPFTATALPTYIIRSNLLNAFTGLDKRKANWTNSRTVANVTYTNPFKYKVSSNTAKTERQMMFRLAEVYLNRAEAKAKLNDPTAIDDLNKTRVRAGLQSLTALSGTQLVDAIIAERRLELFAECGLRWFDLKRTGLIDQINIQIKPGWAPYKKFFPIPNADILAAPNLTQNPGYN